MKKRIMAAAVLVPLLLFMLFALPKWVTAVALSLVSALAAYELLYNTGFVRHVRLVAYSVILAAIVPIWCHLGQNDLWAKLGILIFFLLLFMEMILSGMRLKFEKASVCVFGALLIPYLLSSVGRIMDTEVGRYVILVPFVIAFLSDSGAYFIGCRFGKHKMSPVISPNKSVEGLLGGIAVSTLGMLAYVAIMQLIFKCQVNYGYALVYGIVGSLAGTFGDLCFSLIKRQTGVKDFGTLIPGHGGALDRFDSMLVVAPLVELLMAVFPVVVK